ncbi:cysteine hydrolase family protein [Alicyclobacillus acidiphilus]|jgi:nicotinamidase-related amidase|uniref:cysteine hydrolase family protein n=1 Tax=Alicyclobacillus acidiphilus TaxID=182455 RepID=UPI00082BE7AD|nr:isochorismatase family cysteine hydrolase [Alicyclobacillus acidiphilus]
MPQEALLIIDMSNDFVHERGSLTAGDPARAIVPYIADLAERMREAGSIVAICMDTHHEGDRHFQEWPPHNVEGTWGHELYGRLRDWYESAKRASNVWWIPKASYNAFYGTGLAERLRAEGVGTVHITGVCTDICDFLTAAGAYDEGFATVVHRHGCATFTDGHERFLKQMELCFHSRIV